jgi:hypothetical protein
LAECGNNLRRTKTRLIHMNETTVDQEKIDSDFLAAAEAKAKELSDKSGKPVIYFTMPDGIDRFVVYMYQPSETLLDKICWMKLVNDEGLFAKAKTELQSLVWWEESDARIKTPSNMRGAALYLLSLAEITLPDFKKK